MAIENRWGVSISSRATLAIAQETLETLQHQATQIDENLRRKADELRRANAMKVNLERDLNDQKRQLETMAAETQRLEGECSRDQGQLDEAMDLLRDNKHTLAQEERREIEAKRQLDQQLVKVNNAETLVQQRERDEANTLNDYHQATRDEQDAQVNLDAAETEMDRLKEILRTAAVVGIAFAWTLIGGLVGLGTALATESAIRDHTSQLNACKQQLNSRSRIRDQKYQSHQAAISNTHQAREMFATEEATIGIATISMATAGRSKEHCSTPDQYAGGPRFESEPETGQLERTLRYGGRQATNERSASEPSRE